MNARPQVIAVDVDGTLYDGVSIHPDAVAALADARDEGDTILIVSGRPWRDLPLIAPGSSTSPPRPCARTAPCSST